MVLMSLEKKSEQERNLILNLLSASTDPPDSMSPLREPNQFTTFQNNYPNNNNNNQYLSSSGVVPSPGRSPANFTNSPMIPSIQSPTTSRDAHASIHPPFIMVKLPSTLRKEMEEEESRIMKQLALLEEDLINNSTGGIYDFLHSYYYYYYISSYIIRCSCPETVCDF